MKVTDPVCGMAIEAEQAFAKTEHAGKTYYFCGEACHKRFAAEKYAGRTSQESSGHNHH